MIPLDEVRRAESLAAASKRTRDGPTCARSPEAISLLRLDDPNAVTGDIFAQCEGVIGGGCAVSIRFVDENGRSLDRLPDLEARLEPPALELQQWVSALGRLRRAKPSAQSIGILAPSPRDDLELYTSSLGEWKSNPRKVLEQQAAGLSSCLVSAPQEVVTVQAQLRIGEDGSVSTVSLPPGPGSSRLPTCLHDLFAGLTFPTTDNPRRRILNVIVYRPFGYERQLDLRVRYAPRQAAGQPSSGGLVGFMGPSFRQAAEACHRTANRSRKGGTAVRVQVDVAANGRPAGAQVSVVIAPDDTATAFGRCMQDAVRETAWPCPGSGEPTTVEALVCQRPRQY